MYGELGRVPLKNLHKVRVLKYWFQILSMPLSLLYKIYNQQVADVNTGVNSNSVASNLKRLLDNLGFTYLWNSPNMSQLQFLNMVIQTVYDQFLQSWYADVNDSSKLSVYHISN